MNGKGVIFNGKHSFRDIGITVEKIEIGFPTKIKITENIPFMNGKYDFSTALTNGESVFSERVISVTFNLITDKYKTKTIAERRVALLAKASTVLSWLVDTNGKKPLVLDSDTNYYYDAEVETEPKFEDIDGNGKLKIEFTCYPFKKSINITSYSYTNSGTISYTFLNKGRQVTPVIKCSVPGFVVEIGNRVYTLIGGEQVIWGARLFPGNNTIKVTGTGTIEIKFREEFL